MDINVGRLFQTPLLRDMFRELFSVTSRNTSEDVPNGPLAYIIREYSLAMAKGGTKYPEKPDQTYFTHIVNGLVIGGRLFENKLLERFGSDDKFPLETEKFLRLYFASFVLHDINKLNDGATLVNTIKNDWNKFSIIVAPFLSKIGEAPVWSEDLKYLILSTEEGTKDYANPLKTNTNRDSLENIARYMKFSDRIGTIKSTTSLQIYYDLKNIFDEFASEWNKNLHIVTFADVPQTMLRLRASNAVLKALEGNGRSVVMKTPDALIFQGQPITSDIISKSAVNMSNELSSGAKSLVSLYAPSSNSIKYTFAEKIIVTSEVVDTFIEEWRGRLLLWSGRPWRMAHTDFEVIMRSKYGISFKKKSDTTEDSTYSLEIPEVIPGDEAVDTDLKLKLCRSKLIIANRIALDLDVLSIQDPRVDAWLIENMLLGTQENIDTVLRKTLSAVALTIIDGSSDPEGAYLQLCGKIAASLETMYPNKDIIDAQGFIQSIICSDGSDTDPLVYVHALNVDKKEMCLQCGTPAIINIDASRVFAYGATSGSGRKVTKLKDDPLFKGRICQWCELENRIRRTIFGAEREKGIVIQSHIGDYLVPLDVWDMTNALKLTENTGDNRSSIDRASGSVRFTRYDDPHKLDHHTTVFHGTQSKRTDQFYFLQQLLRFVSDTGIKIHVTPLHGGSRIRMEQFTWENAPGWVKSLSMNTLRINEIRGALEELDFLGKVASLGRGAKDIQKVLSARVLHPMKMFTVIYNFANGNSGINISLIKYDLSKFINKYTKEVNQMRMNTIVGEACKILYQPPKSNNEHTWLIRTSFDVLLRNEAAERDERITRCAGSLLEIAKRKESFNQKGGADACMAFSENLVALLDEQFGGKVPPSAWRRDIIAQFALMYNQQKWAEVVAMSEEKKKNTLVQKPQEAI